MTIAQIGDLADIHGTAIYSFCYHLTGNKDEADDLYQETFLKAVELSKRLNQDRNPKNFLIGIAIKIYKNNKSKAIRRMKIAPVESLSDEISETNVVLVKETPEENYLQQEEADNVRKIVKSLPDTLNLVLYMYYTIGLSVNEIANILHVPIGTVKSRLHKARKLVKLYWEESGYER